MDTLLSADFVVPEVVVSHFHINEGDTVADFGTGSGYFLKPLSERVGPAGRVYACEIQRTLVDKVNTLIHTQNLNNIHPLWCDLEEPNGIKIQTGAVDTGILSNTLFQLEDKDGAAREMIRTLRSGGKLFVIDWSESFSGIGPSEQNVIARTDTIALFERNHLVFERDFPAGAHHYGVAFRKP